MAGVIGLQRGNTHEVDAGITASASLGIDQSIDTLRLDEYDYIEEVRFNWLNTHSLSNNYINEEECAFYISINT